MSSAEPRKPKEKCERRTAKVNEPGGGARRRSGSVEQLVHDGMEPFLGIFRHFVSELRETQQQPPKIAKASV